MDNQELADKLVNQNLSIGRKTNPGIKKAKSKYGEEIIDKIKEKTEEIKEKKIKELKKPRYGPLIHEEKGKLKLKEEIGYSVIIKCHPNNKDLAREIERKCLKNGAHTLLLTTNVERAKEKYNLPPQDSLKELPEISKSLAGEPDYTIAIEPIESTSWKKNISKQRLKSHAPVKKKTSEIRDKNKVRWSLIGWPHKEIAKELGITHRKFKGVLESTLEESFNPEMRELTKKWHETLKGTEEITIESEEGTELTLEVKGRHFLEDNGILSKEDIERGDIGMNFPCGEVFTAPQETGAEGEIFIPKTVVSSYGTVEDLWLEFEEGKVEDYSAEKNEEYLTRFFEENTEGIKTIAELGIGCNKEAEYTEGYILIDEKIMGTIHIAVGWNKGFGGETQASSHHDFIKPMDKGKMYADGQLVMEKGKPIWKTGKIKK